MILFHVIDFFCNVCIDAEKEIKVENKEKQAFFFSEKKKPKCILLQAHYSEGNALPLSFHAPLALGPSQLQRKDRAIPPKK